MFVKVSNCDSVAPRKSCIPNLLGGREHTWYHSPSAWVPLCFESKVDVHGIRLHIATHITISIAFSSFVQCAGQGKKDFVLFKLDTDPPEVITLKNEWTSEMQSVRVHKTKCVRFSFYPNATPHIKHPKKKEEDWWPRQRVSYSSQPSTTEELLQLQNKTFWRKQSLFERTQDMFLSLESSWCWWKVKKCDSDRILHHASQPSKANNPSTHSTTQWSQ